MQSATQLNSETEIERSILIFKYNNHIYVIMITIVTCWYILKSKFNKNKYEEWFKNFLLNANNFKLIIFTNNESKYMLDKYINNMTYR